MGGPGHAASDRHVARTGDDAPELYFACEDFGPGEAYELARGESRTGNARLLRREWVDLQAFEADEAPVEATDDRREYFVFALDAGRGADTAPDSPADAPVRALPIEEATPWRLLVEDAPVQLTDQQLDAIRALQNTPNRERREAAAGTDSSELI